MRAGGPAAIKPLAHTLKGSASGIGAGDVARAAEAAKQAVASECSAAVDRLALAVADARALIAELLRMSRSLALARAGECRYRSRANSGAFPPRVRMPKITYIDAGGSSRTVDAVLGSTVMETALRNAIPGIEAECGGACACATCHVYVDEAWRERVGEPSPMEEDMLDFGYDVRPNSRLSCQIKVTDALDGLVVRTPEKQA